MYFRSSRIFYGTAEYASRDRCREDFYSLASTPIPLSDVETIGSAPGLPIPNQNNAVLQQSSLPSTLQKQSPSTQANVSSVFYTVQRVITTSQIQASGTFVGGTLATNDCTQAMLPIPQGTK